MLLTGASRLDLDLILASEQRVSTFLSLGTSPFRAARRGRGTAGSAGPSGSLAADRGQNVD